MMILVVLTAALALSAGSTHAAIYKWVDEKGVTQYSSEKPPPGKKVHQLQTPPPEPPSPATVPSAPAAKTWQEKEAEFQRRRAAEDEARMKREAAEQAAAVERTRSCALARQNLHAIEQERAVYWIDERGERVYLEDKDREQVRQRLRQLVEENCKFK